MKYLIAALLMVPTMTFAHERIVHGIVVPNGYAPAWDNGRVNRNAGNINGASFVEAGHFHSAAEAAAAGERLFGGGVQIVQDDTGHYSIWVGPYANRDAAQEGLNAVHAAGLGHGWVR